jgi:hypothetical protein
MKIKQTVRSSMAQALPDDIESGSGAAVIEIYTGTIPPAMGAAITETRLGALTCSDPAASLSGGVITFSAISEDPSADATGDAGWARLLNGAGDESVYLTVSGPGGGGEIVMNTVSIVAGGPVRIQSLSISMGG